MKQADTIICARWIIPVEPAHDVLDQHALVIKDGCITDILPQHKATQTYQAETTFSLTQHALIPGFINSHTHAAMALMRGVADDLPLQDWLHKHIWPIESTWAGPEFVRDGTQLAIAEMLRGGVTCFNDMYFFPDEVALTATKIGIRANVGLIVLDFPSAWAQNVEEYLHKGLEVHDSYRQSSLITTALAPHAPYTVSDGPLEQIVMYAEELDVQIHMHVHETAHEVKESVLQHSNRPLTRLDALGIVSHRLEAVHMTQLTTDEIQLIAQKSAHVIHCPESNLKLASGICPIDKLVQKNINVALGTDGQASNNDLDMFGEMRTAALLAKGTSQDASVIPASTALRMATLNGAKALGIDQFTGSLTAGKFADIVAIDFSGIETQPLYDPISQLVYTTGREKVQHVWVAGKHLLNNRQLTSIDTDQVLYNTEKWQNKILSGIH